MKTKQHAPVSEQPKNSALIKEEEQKTSENNIAPVKTEEQKRVESENTKFQEESAEYVSNLYSPAKEKEGYFYSTDGTLVSQTKDSKSKDVYIVEKKKNAWDYTNAVKLNLGYDEFIKFAGVIHIESGGDKKETFAIGTAIINASKNGGQSVSYLIGNSNFTKAILNSKYSSFIKAPNNNNFAISGTVNALLYQIGDARGTDYSNGAVMWEGGELAAKGEKQHKPSFYGTSISEEDWKAFSNYWTENKKALKADYKKDKVADISSDYDKEDKSYELEATAGKNKDKTLIKSTAVYGGTIFFGANKTKENKDYPEKYLSIYTDPAKAKSKKNKKQKK